MQRIKRIRQRIYDFFHPSVESLMREFAIAEEPITQEEYEKCIKMIAKLGVADAEQFVDLSIDEDLAIRKKVAPFHGSGCSEKIDSRKRRIYN